MAISVSIKGVERAGQIDWRSLKITNILTKQVDKCTFTILNYGGKTYKPDLGNEVIVSEGATKYFGGVVNSITEVSEAYKVIGYKIDCSDFSRLADGRLISETYENMTVNAIIADIVAHYLPTGFTQTNVVCPIVVDFIAFNYQNFTSCMKELAALANYDWYIDPDKDIHFFANDSTPAPFDLNDNDGSYIYESLEIKRDNSQIRNTVIVRGGEYLANTTTSEMLGNGTDTIFPLPYRFEDYAATLTATTLKIGIDFSADPDDYDALFNRDEKILKFKKGEAPRVGSLLTFWGRPYLPVIVKKKNQASIEAMSSAEGGNGQYEYLIIDKKINSLQGARDRAAAELYAYARSINEGSFRTEKDGLRAGQQLRINSATRSVDEFFMVNRVQISMRTPAEMIYDVQIVSTKTFGMIDLLRKIFTDTAKNEQPKSREVVDVVEGADEFITMADTATIASATDKTETITCSETFTAQSPDYDTEFVLGDYTWAGEGSGDHKRMICLDGGELS